MVIVSVIIPVYNAETYLKECLDSVLSQTMGHLEVICIDDGSTDNSRCLIQEYQKADSRIRILEQENQGPGPARNRGIRAAAGKYISFLDADDFWHDENVLAKIVDAANKNDSDITGAFWGHYKEGKYSRSQLHHAYFGQGENGKWIPFEEEQNCYNYGSYLFKKELLAKNNIFFPAYYRFQDPPFLANAMLQAKCYYVIPVDWYCYRTGYKTVLSTPKNIVDFVKGVTDVLEIAQTFHMQKLLAEMVFQVNTAMPYIISGIMQGNTELLTLLDKANNLSADKSMGLGPVLFLKEAIYEKCKEMADALWSKLKDANKLVIYGAGYYGNLVLRQIEKCRTDLEIVFAQTTLPVTRKRNGRDCVCIEELAGDRETVLVLIAVLEETQPELVANIKRLGFKNYICLGLELMTALECMGNFAAGQGDLESGNGKNGQDCCL